MDGPDRDELNRKLCERIGEKWAIWQCGACGMQPKGTICPYCNGTWRVVENLTDPAHTLHLLAWAKTREWWRDEFGGPNGIWKGHYMSRRMLELNTPSDMALYVFEQVCKHEGITTRSL